MWTSHKPEDCKGIEPGAKYRNEQNNKIEENKEKSTVSETLIAPYQQNLNEETDEE